MTYETLRDSNEIGLFNFVESLCTLSIGIQNMNAQDISIDYFKDANSRLKDVILTLHLLLHRAESLKNVIETCDIAQMLRRKQKKMLDRLESRKNVSKSKGWTNDQRFGF